MRCLHGNHHKLKMLLSWRKTKHLQQNTSVVRAYNLIQSLSTVLDGQHCPETGQEKAPTYSSLFEIKYCVK